MRNIYVLFVLLFIVVLFSFKNENITSPINLMTDSCCQKISVIDNAGYPVAGCLIEIKDTSGVVVGSCITDSLGCTICLPKSDQIYTIYVSECCYIDTKPFRCGKAIEIVLQCENYRKH